MSATSFTTSGCCLQTATAAHPPSGRCTFLSWFCGTLLSMAKTATNYRGAAVQSLVTQSSTGVGTSFDLGGGYATFSVQLQCTTAGTGTATAQLTGSLDGTNFTNISGASTCSTSARLALSTGATPVQFVRLNVTAIGSTDTVINGWICPDG